MMEKQKTQTVLAKWASEKEAERMAEIERNEPPQGIDSEESMTVTEADIEEARQALKQRRRAYGVKYRARKRRAKLKSGGQPGPRRRPAGPPVYYSLESGEPTVVEQGIPGEIGTVLEEEIRSVYGEIAEMERQIAHKRSYVSLLIQGSKRLAQKAKPVPSAKIAMTPLSADEKNVPKPGTLTAEAIAVLRRIGRPLYINELAREMGIHSAKKRGALLGTISPNASKGKFGLIRTAPSVFALAEWGEVK
jgi:hypothetical protein